MEVPLTPLEFARRTRALYPQREAVVDGAMRLTYEQFFDRCDRWSAALQRARREARATGSPTSRPTPTRSSSAFYAVPQIGAVLVPINYRLTADDFVYIINHCGASRRLRACGLSRGGRRDPRAARRRGAFRRARGRAARAGSTTKRSSRRRRPAFAAACRRSRESDLLTINYTSGTTSRPKGVMITHRNAYMNAVGTLVHLPMTHGRPLSLDAADVPRERLDVHVDRDGGRRARTSVCARSIPRGCSSRFAGGDHHARARRRPC